MKKLFSCSAIAVFFLSTVTVFAITFVDVPADHPNLTAIKYLQEKGIVSGYGDGTFKPSNNISRSEATKIITKALNVKTDGTYDTVFSDVTKDAWSFPFVMGAKEAGLIKGYPDGTFKPDATITLGETLKISFIAAGFSVPTSVSEKVFLDVPSTSWYAPYALYGRNHNIVLGDEAGNLSGDRQMTRAEFAEIIYRVMLVKESGEKEFPLGQSWPTYQNSSLNFEMKYSPVDFEIIEHDDEVIFFKKDTTNYQTSYGRIYPNTAIVRVTVDENPEKLTANDFFNNLKAAFAGAKFTDFNFNGLPSFEVLFTDKRIVDWYIALPNNKIMIIYTEYGNGAVGYKVQKQIKAMLNSFKYGISGSTDNDNDSDYESLLSEIFENILVEDKGMTMLNKLPDKTIIETDSLGVGTGPVDYYYSEKVNYTFKYERASDVILDKRKGETSAF